MKKFFLFLIVLSSTRLFSQADIVAIIAGGEYVKNILKKFEITATTLLNQADNTGNALLSKAGNEINVATKNAGLLLSRQMDKTYSQLSTENQKLLNEIEKFRISAEKISNNTFELKDALIIDLKKILGDALPWSKTDFYVQRISGATQLRQTQADYSINILGIGFGFNQENFEARITEVYLNNNKIGITENKLSASESQLIIPYLEINRYSSETKLSNVKMKIIVETKRKTGWIFRSWNSKRFELPITFTILPRKISNVTVKYSIPRNDWQVITARSEYNYTTPNHHQEGKPIIHYTYTKDVRLPDNQRFSNKILNSRTPEGGGCPWTYFNSLDILENGKLLTAKFETWGYPCTYYFAATIEEYKEIGSDERSLPPMFLEYGKNFVVELPKEAKYWQIEGKTIDFKDIDVVGKTDFGSLITFQDIYEVGNVLRIVYRVGLPY